MIGSGDPVALETDVPLVAGSPESFAINPKDRIAVVERTSMKTNDPFALTALLKVIASPDAARKRLEEISVREGAVVEKEAALRLLSAKVEDDRRAAEAEQKSSDSRNFQMPRASTLLVSKSLRGVKHLYGRKNKRLATRQTSLWRCGLRLSRRNPG